MPGSSGDEQEEGYERVASFEAKRFTNLSSQEILKGCNGCLSDGKFYGLI